MVTWMTDNFVMVLVIGVVVVAALVGLLIFLRNQRPD